MNPEFDSQPPAEDPVEGEPKTVTPPLDAPKIGPRESIAWVIEQVQTGKLTPAQATEWLIGTSQTTENANHQGPLSVDITRPQQPQSRGESIAQLVARLGAPPSDVIESWREQFRQLNGGAHATGQKALPQDLRRWLVAPSGELYLSTSDEPVALSSPPPPDSLVELLFGFAPHGDLDEKEDQHTEVNRTRRQQGRPSPLLGLLAKGMLLGGIAAISAILYWASRPNPAETITEKSPVIHAAGDGTPSRAGTSSRDGLTTAKKNDPSRPSTQGIDPSPAAALSSGDLETFQSVVSDNHAETEIDPLSELLPLDRFFPSSPILASEASGRELESSATNASSDALANAGDIETDPVTDLGSASARLSSGAGDDPLADESDQSQPDESPQPIRQASTTAITLPPTSDSQTLVSLSPLPLAEPTLVFPMDVTVDLRPATNSGDAADAADAQATAPAWAFVDRPRDEVLARIFTTAESSTFQWTPAAGSSSVASLMGHGQLQDQAGQQIFMRPQIIADTYRLSFDQSDARPSWDLSLPLPPRVSRISVDLDFPKPTKSRGGLELGWIEPIDTTSPRGTRGLAVLTPVDGETVAVGIRFDMRCTRTLVSRIRLFGRLDSRTPWQLISRPMLTNLTEQVTRQASRLSQWSIQMSKVYAQANSDQRRLLRPQRDAISQQQDRLVEISKRLVALQGLINQIENEVQVRLRVWVEWPVAEGLTASPAAYQQDLLRMDVRVE